MAIESGLFQNFRRIAKRTNTHIRFFYLALFYVAIVVQEFLPKIIATDKSINLWPSFWTNYVGFETGVMVINTILLLSTAFAMFCPQKRLARFLAFIGLLLFLSILNAPWSINRSYHGLLWLSFLFIFLPNQAKSKSRKLDLQTIHVFYCAQIFSAICYFLTGFWKIIQNTRAVYFGNPSYFTSDAFPRMLSDWFVIIGESGILGDAMIEQPFLGTILLFLTVYIEIFAICCLLSRKYQKVWAVYLLCMHVMIYLVMGIEFHAQVLVVLILFATSPLSEHRITIKQLATGLVTGPLYCLKKLIAIC